MYGFWPQQHRKCPHFSRWSNVSEVFIQMIFPYIVIRVPTSPPLVTVFPEIKLLLHHNTTLYNSTSESTGIRKQNLPQLKGFITFWFDSKLVVFFFRSPHLVVLYSILCLLSILLNACNSNSLPPPHFCGFLSLCFCSSSSGSLNFFVLVRAYFKTYRGLF